MHNVEDCYFFVEGEKEGEQIIRCLCLECHKTKFRMGWFYNAKRQGYGPFDYKCAKCEKIIFKGNQDEENQANNEVK